MSQRRLAILLESHLERCPSQTAYDPTWYPMAQLLAHVGVGQDVYVDYLVTAKVDVGRLKWAGPEVQEGMAALAQRLAAYQPHFVLLLDRHGYLLRAFHGDKRGVDNWRGSVLLATHTLPGIKVMATFAPTRLRMDYGLTGVVRLDLQKAMAEARTDTLDVPQDDIAIDLTKEELVVRLREVYEQDLHVATDIEGYPDRITCIGFATGPNKAFVVPFVHTDGTSWWDEADEIELWEWVAKVLEKPTVKKDCHNALYELFCLAWSYGIVIEGLEHDTMVLWAELYAEMEKSLGFVASILTKQPWYKHERGATDDSTQLRYNGKDCCRTYEVRQRMVPMLREGQARHYRFNMDLLVPLAYMSLRGIRYDEKEAKRRLAATQETIYELQDQINQEAARAESREDLRQFYLCFGFTPLRVLDQVPDTDRSTPVEPENATLGSNVGFNVEAILPLLTTAFCQARRTEHRLVEETTWQLMHFKKGKWVKQGKRLSAIPEATQEISPDGYYIQDQEPDGTGSSHWLKPVRKLVLRNVPVEVETLEDVRRFTLASQSALCKRAITIIKDGMARRSDVDAGQVGQSTHSIALSPAQRGELATLLGIHVKINATGRGKDKVQEDGTVIKGDERDANWFVYEHCKAPKQYKREAGQSTDRLTSSTDAVLLAYLATQDPRLKLFMSWRAADTRRESLVAKPDPDGRMRCSYNVVGTKTGRLSCGTGNTGSGYNLQTVTEELRDLFPADEGCEFGQFDLRGADGYTLASQCAQHGDFTMLHDLMAGLKPVNIIVLLYTEGVHINNLSREELKVAQKRVAKESWQYIATKPIFYGYAYLMGARKMSEGIAEDSYAETGVATIVPPKRCEEIMRMIDVRYPGIKRVQVHEGGRLMKDGILHSTVGWSRKFFGRKSKKDKLGVMVPDRTNHGDWLATLPQFNTTYATKKGLAAMWADPENRREYGSLRIEPLHTVHDSLNPQWRVEDREFARAKVLPVYFNNPFNVAGQTLVIPASGTYGKSWGEQKESL